eukprot:756113-Hanusia_phi.AAC.1
MEDVEEAEENFKKALNIQPSNKDCMVRWEGRCSRGKEVLGRKRGVRAMVRGRRGHSKPERTV